MPEESGAYRPPYRVDEKVAKRVAEALGRTPRCHLVPRQLERSSGGLTAFSLDYGVVLVGNELCTHFVPIASDVSRSQPP